MTNSVGPRLLQGQQSNKENDYYVTSYPDTLFDFDWIVWHKLLAPFLSQFHHRSELEADQERSAYQCVL